jgi:hypothetical protein
MAVVTEELEPSIPGVTDDQGVSIIHTHTPGVTKAHLSHRLTTTITTATTTTITTANTTTTTTANTTNTVSTIHHDNVVTATPTATATRCICRRHTTLHAQTMDGLE